MSYAKEIKLKSLVVKKFNCKYLKRPCIEIFIVSKKGGTSYIQCKEINLVRCLFNTKQ